MRDIPTIQEAIQHLRTLELSPGVTMDGVRTAYRTLAKVWHPDRFPGDPSTQALAGEKLKAINHAYDWLRQNQPILSRLQTNESASRYQQAHRVAKATPNWVDPTDVPFTPSQQRTTTPPGNGSPETTLDPMTWHARFAGGLAALIIPLIIWAGVMTLIDKRGPGTFVTDQPANAESVTESRRRGPIVVLYQDEDGNIMARLDTSDESGVLLAPSALPAMSSVSSASQHRNPNRSVRQGSASKVAYFIDGRSVAVDDAWMEGGVVYLRLPGGNVVPTNPERIRGVFFPEVE